MENKGTELGLISISMKQLLMNGKPISLLRTVLQEEAKQDALGKLDDETCQPRTQG